MVRRDVKAMDRAIAAARARIEAEMILVPNFDPLWKREIADMLETGWPGPALEGTPPRADPPEDMVDWLMELAPKD